MKNPLAGIFTPKPAPEPPKPEPKGGLDVLRGRARGFARTPTGASWMKEALHISGAEVDAFLAGGPARFEIALLIDFLGMRDVTYDAARDLLVSECPASDQRRRRAAAIPGEAVRPRLGADRLPAATPPQPFRGRKALTSRRPRRVGVLRFTANPSDLDTVKNAAALHCRSLFGAKALADNIGVGPAALEKWLYGPYPIVAFRPGGAGESFSSRGKAVWDQGARGSDRRGEAIEHDDGHARDRRLIFTSLIAQAFVSAGCGKCREWWGRRG